MASPAPLLPQELPPPAGRASPREVAALAYFDRAGQLVGARHVIGAADHVALAARTVARDVVAFNAALVVLIHTHPSGDARPSADDLRLTRILARALRALDVELFDHLVVGREITSLRGEGLL